ncbi:MAG: hypothetical protein COB04_01170 [Gammaproteobacteria bacterium]|nr:MAG: hypothetical protein COB04_01170 [Gammaproteobacteria bacterium]
MLQVIAEIGLNHNGSERRAWDLFTRVVDSQVDGITFQVREKEFYDESHPRKIELSDAFYKKAINFAKKRKVAFGVALANQERISFFQSLGISFWKTLSWDLGNNALQTALQKTNNKVYISTGLSDLDEIVAASKQYQNVEFIHTQLNYDLEGVNLKALTTIQEDTGKSVAFGLHNDEHAVLFSAVGFAPDSVFFYVKDDTDGEHPDDAHAISVSDLPDLVDRLKRLSLCVGDGCKQVQENTLHPEDDLICQ